MPTYNYKCTDCDNEFEKYEKIPDRDASTTLPCEMCGGVVIRPPAIGGFGFDDVPKLSGDFKNLLQNIKKKNSTRKHTSMIGEIGR